MRRYTGYFGPKLYFVIYFSYGNVNIIGNIYCEAAGSVCTLVIAGSESWSAQYLCAEETQQVVYIQLLKEPSVGKHLLI